MMTKKTTTMPPGEVADEAAAAAVDGSAERRDAVSDETAPGAALVPLGALDGDARFWLVLDAAGGLCSALTAAFVAARVIDGDMADAHVPAFADLLASPLNEPRVFDLAVAGGVVPGEALFRTWHAATGQPGEAGAEWDALDEVARFVWQIAPEIVHPIARRLAAAADAWRARVEAAAPAAPVKLSDTIFEPAEGAGDVETMGPRGSFTF